MADGAKVEALIRLGAQRKATRRGAYKTLGDFHNGLYECDYVSPWSRMARNADAEIMIVGQDWASSDMLTKPPNEHWAQFGYDPGLPTNKLLDRLLKENFGVNRGDCYLTNLFPFIKLGRASATIPMADLVWSAQEFTRREIQVVSPTIAICLGLRTFRALMRVAGLGGSPKLDEAIAAPFRLESAMVHCVAHTGAFGTNNRSLQRVNEDWRKLAQLYPHLCCQEDAHRR